MSLRSLNTDSLMNVHHLSFLAQPPAMAILPSYVYILSRVLELIFSGGEVVLVDIRKVVVVASVEA